MLLLSINIISQTNYLECNEIENRTINDECPWENISKKILAVNSQFFSTCN